MFKTNLRCINFSLIFVLYFTVYKCFTQNNFNTLGESSLYIKHKFSEQYNFDFIFRSRYFLYENNTFLYQQQQVDVFHLSHFKLNTYSKIGLGLYYRNRDWFKSGNDEFRFIEEYNISKQKANAKLKHRVRLEQRILSKHIIYRQRYRLSVNTPLNNTLDIGNTYLVNSIEGLLSVNKIAKPETDIRISSQIGWQIAKKIKFQTGLEHRLEAFNLTAKNNLFVLTSALFTI